MLTLTHLIGFAAALDSAAPPGVPYGMFRLTVNAWNAGATSCALREVRFLKTSDVCPSANMTGNSAPSPLAASAVSGTTDAYAAFDGSSVGVDFGAAAADRWVQINLGGETAAISGVRITPVVLAGYAAPSDFTVAGSNDGSTWTTLYSATGLSGGWADGVARDVGGFAAAAPYGMFRLTVNAWNAGATYGALREVRFLKPAVCPFANMTGNSAPSPLAASAVSGATGAYAAFDGSSAGVDFGAAAADRWVQINLGGETAAVTGVRITPVVLSGYTAPEALTVAGSNDGSTWTTLYAASGLSGGWADGVTREFNF